MRIKPLPLSVSFAGQLRTLAFFFPTEEDNSRASPVDIFMRSATFGSIRAIFLPTSRCSATSATFRVTTFAFPLDLSEILLLPPPPLLLLSVLLLLLLSLLSISEDILFYHWL